ncbi:response regulator [Planctobacterium marinum]|uniref:Response regulatory domain-containing protein n=1 Tax=Planctobacterium marinum TaxID=1631968 RepID=A0AA48KQT0_9ALTE|nr:hypothetical protein MACH26_02500 [Planctobacterium marinum]
MLDIPAPRRVSELTALIIDEDPLVHELIKSAMLEIGISKIATAQNAYYAVRRCEQTRFDIVLISFNVQSDKDGFHLLEELKFKGYVTKATTVIFLSAETAPELVHCVVEMQPNDFWVKPLDRNRVENRLRHIFEVRKRLHRLYYCVDTENYSSAIYLADELLKRNELAHYFPNIKRVKGECLFKLFEFAEAQKYYEELQHEYKYGWVSIGLLRAMLAQDKLEEAEPKIKELKEREDTRFLVYDVLAHYFIEHEDYKNAYEEIKTATQLAPRNIERNRKSCDLARLNHDRKGQYLSAQNVAKYARNSIHDSPDLRLNVVRTGIDLATTLTAGEARTLYVKIERMMRELEAEFGKQLEEPLTVVKVRLLCVRQNKKEAEKLLKDKVSQEANGSIDENLEKVKAFHELGMREESLKLLEEVKKQIGGDSWSGRVVSEYIEQEKIERKEIHFTAKELGEMAKTHFKEKRFKPAYANLTQAFKLSPNNPQLAMSLLRLLTAMVEQEKDTLDEHQQSLACECAAILAASDMENDTKQKLEMFAKILKIDLANLSL